MSRLTAHHQEVVLCICSSWDMLCVYVDWLLAGSRSCQQPVNRIRTELQFRPDLACKLSANLYDIYHCCVYSEKFLMMDRGTVRNI